MSPQDDHVIEFAKQFGWDSTWMEKQAKKKGKKKLDEEAARGSQDVGEMLGAVSGASASQVDQSSQVAVVPTQAPQVKAPPPPPQPQVKAPSQGVPPEPLRDHQPPMTPQVMSTPPPRRRRRAEETEAEENRLAVIARTAQSKALPVHVAPPPAEDTFEAELQAELDGQDSREESHEESREESHELKTCVICFEACDPSDGEYPLEALPCAHVFHVACLAAWRETTRISDRSRCPNGCHRVHGHPFFRSFGQPSQVPPHVADDPGDAHATEPADSPDALMSPGEVAFL